MNVTPEYLLQIIGEITSENICIMEGKDMLNITQEDLLQILGRMTIENRRLRSESLKEKSEEETKKGE